MGNTKKHFHKISLRYKEYYSTYEYSPSSLEKKKMPLTSYIYSVSSPKVMLFTYSKILYLSFPLDLYYTGTL